MNPALVSLAAAAIAFVGTHFAMSHPLRAPMVGTLGEAGFMGVYSLVSFATFAWMAMAFRAASPSPVAIEGTYGLAVWVLASVLTLVALVLFLGSLRGNPALPDPRAAEGLDHREPAGVFRVTRHPMMWGFGLWAIAHLLVAPAGRTLIIGLAILILALLGAHLQDRKKEALMGAGWQAWEAKTSYWPRWSKLAGAGPVLWIAALAIWLGVTWAHDWLSAIPAGVWRWVG
ncbi:MAG: MFS transporter [Sphingomonadales bacterium]|nr:MFS transporter [Sphingomonadales bacterium]MDE2567880.1 MFS transporter [Sphingomonadales bacterium]